MNLVKVKSETKIAWLLEGDPSIRYQTFRDLAHEKENIVKQERDKILRSGWGKQIMDLQDPEGTWAKGLYTPKWTSTFYTLLLLKRLGAPTHSQIRKACEIFLNKGFYIDGGINLWKSYKHSETCVTGMFLNILCHFKIQDERIHLMANHLIDQQMEDKGWNCRSYNGDTHSSFHTTLSVLEGLWQYQNYNGCKGVQRLIKKQEEGIEFLLQHKLFRSHRTGRIVNSKMTRFTFPPRWKYDIMRCLDYFQSRYTMKDSRMEDAIKIIHSKRTKEGLWLSYSEHNGKTFFKLEIAGIPSRWNTLRALRILKWWDNDLS